MKISAQPGATGVPFAAVAIALVFAAAAVAPGHASRTGALVALAVIVLRLLKGRRLTGLDAAVGAFVTWITASALFTSDTIAGRYLYWDLVAGALVFIAIRVTVEAPRHLVVIGGVFVTTAVYMAFNLQPNDGRAATTVPGSADVALRSTYAGLNSNHVAYAMTAACFLLLMLAYRGRARSVRFLALVGVGALLHFGIRATDTRGALVAVALMLLLLPLCKLAAPLLRGISLRAFATGAVLLSIALSTGLLAQMVTGRLTRDERETGTLNGRLEIWPRAVESIGENPIAGKGAGTSMDLNGGFAMHNALLDVTVDFGLVGLILWTGIVLTSIRATREAGREISYPILASTAMLAPIFLSGYWFSSAAAWGILGLMSTFGVLGSRTGNAPPEAPVAVRRSPSPDAVRV